MSWIKTVISPFNCVCTWATFTSAYRCGWHGESNKRIPVPITKWTLLMENCTSELPFCVPSSLPATVFALYQIINIKQILSLSKCCVLIHSLEFAISLLLQQQKPKLCHILLRWILLIDDDDVWHYFLTWAKVCRILFSHSLLIRLSVCNNVLFMICFYRIYSVGFLRKWFLSKSFCIHFDFKYMKAFFLFTNTYKIFIARLPYPYSFHIRCQVNAQIDVFYWIVRSLLSAAFSISRITDDLLPSINALFVLVFNIKESLFSHLVLDSDEIFLS